MTTWHLIQARMLTRASVALANSACDAVFAVARGVPRQGAIRARLERARLDRAARSATPVKS